VHTRLALYQRLASIVSPEEVAGVEAELSDRFGPLPPEAANLLFIVRLKALARGVRVESVKAEGGQVLLQWPHGQRVDRSRLPPTPGVKAGTSQVRLGLTPGWPRRLEETLRKLGTPSL
jgi:transcription-repair coupling factor (superfamily II helicase)